MTVTDEDDTVPNDNNSVIDRLRAEGAFDLFEARDWAGDSVIGLVRGNNEDRWARVSETLFVVADGMGGHEGGEIASQAIIDSVSESRGGSLHLGVVELVRRVNQAVLAAGAANDVENLGSTLVLVELRGHNILVVGVGDSRVYRLRDGVLEQLTHDHTVRGELLDAGIDVGPYKARGARLDALTSFVGLVGDDPPVVGSASFALASGDRFLLCSDGVHGQIGHSALANHLSVGTCEESVSALLEHADASGGRDNATAVVVEVGLR